MNNNSKKLALVILAVAGLSGCATTQHELAATDAAAAPTQVSRPAAYGSMGGYRYRRLIAVTVVSSS